MFSTYQYYCPKCDARLNKDGMVIFRVMNGSDFLTLIHLNPKPGEYDFECVPAAELEPGKRYDFCCPTCMENLQSPRFKDFVSIWLRPAERIEFEVLFDRAAGQHTTYVITEDMTERHGDHPKDLI